MLAALILGAAGPPAAAAPEPGDDSRGFLGIRLLEAPVKQRGNPRALAYIVDHLNPGATIRRRVEVKNTGPRPWRLKLYAAAAMVERGRFAVAGEETQNELSSWISVRDRWLRVPAGSTRRTVVTIRVPRAASTGERYAVIWAQATARPDRRHNMGASVRVGVRVYLDIGPGGEPPSDFRIEKLTPMRAKDGGAPMLVAMVRNTGGRAIDPGGRLWLSDGPGGMRAGPYPANLGVTLRPGETAPVTVVLDRQIPNGPWDVRLTIRSGWVEHTVTARVTFPASGMGPAISLTSMATGWFAALAGLLMITIGYAALVLARRRRRPAR